MPKPTHLYRYELVRINKATGKKQRIGLGPLILNVLNISEDEWKDYPHE